MLVNPRIIGYANYKLPFIVTTDGSFDGLVVKLSHVQGRSLHRVITYASRRLHAAKRNDAHHSSLKLKHLALK